MSHLTGNERDQIARMLAENKSLREIARALGKSPSSIKREIGRHRVRAQSLNRLVRFMPCAKCATCERRDLCADFPSRRRRRCCFCSEKCWTLCPDYEEHRCPTLEAPPFVCNGCQKRHTCHWGKWLYDPVAADRAYRETLRESRRGVNATEAEIEALNEVVAPLVRGGRQSLHAVVVNNADKITVHEKTLYRYAELGLLRISPCEMPRKERFRPRKAKPVHKVDRKCREGRTFEKFNEYMADKAEAIVVMMDSVEGTRGGKVLLTLFFKSCNLQLAFIRDRNDAASVKGVFDWLRDTLGDKFPVLFPVVLTDNGSEFTDPGAIEKGPDGRGTLRLFYCDPRQSQQKAECEKNHVEIRKILPKGRPLDALTQKEVDLVMSHVNSYPRKSIADKTPFEMFECVYGKGILGTLGIRKVAPNDVTLRPSLLGDKSIVPPGRPIIGSAPKADDAGRKAK